MLVHENGALAARSLYGMFDLLKKYDVSEVEHACDIAVRVGALRLRFVRRILQCGKTPQPLTNTHPLIEEIATYRSHFTRVTQGDLFDAT